MKPTGSDEVQVSEEARRRVDVAQLRTLTFRIKALAGPSFSDDDAEMLAAILIEATDKGQKPTREYVRARLREMERSADSAERLVQILPV